MKIRLLLLSTFFIALSGKMYAQQGERGVIKKGDSSITNGDTYAIIVGISTYKLVSPLKYAHKDAEAFESFLLSDAGGKIPRANIETFLNENATRNNVGDAISIVARKAKPGDRVYFFFAGHGDMEDLTQIENGLLLLYNSPNGNYFGMNDDVLEILDLKRYLSPLAQRGVEMIFIVDACHSGNLKGGVEGVQQTALALANSWGKEYKILSCQPNQLSLESVEWGGGRGLFSLVLEEGMMGLADKNNDGKVSFAELQRYLTDNVSAFSEDKQIPMINGDLSKTFITVNPQVLAALKKQKAQNYPILAVANSKGNDEKRYIDSLDQEGKKIYASFTKNLEEKKLILPKDTNALHDYRVFANKYKDHPLIASMRRNLAAGLNERFNNIVAPLLKDQSSTSSREECYYTAAELDSCLHLLGEQHYMYNNLKARKLFMDAMALTWALDRKDFNISLKPAIERSIQFLEQSEALEPNAAYTLLSLGTLYFYTYEYDKAYAKFQKYLDLRPNDFFSKYSLALLYMKLKQFEKAEALLILLAADKREALSVNSQLFDVYYSEGKNAAALACANKIKDSLDRLTGLFAIGVFYSKAGNTDSAVYYYQLAKSSAKCNICDNNIGMIYFVNDKIDSARKYFSVALADDSTNTNAFPLFNLATIDAMNGEYKRAVEGFSKSIDNAPAFTDAFVTHLDLYFNKHYTITDSSLYRSFRDEAFVLDIQYLGYASILYCFIRDAHQLNDEKLVDQVFSRMFNFKDEDMLTWYHHACFDALKKNKVAALNSLEKSLKLGFGNYFMLTSDDDLAFIRNEPEFKEMLKRYFPDRPGKK